LWSKDGVTFVSGPGNVTLNDQIYLRHTASGANSTQTNQTLTIGGVQGTFTSTTQASAGAEPPWTVLTPSADSRLIYVDATNGSAGGTPYSLDGSAPGGVLPGGTWDNPIGESAYQTVAQGKAQMRDGFPDYLLFKRGETWTNEVIGQIRDIGGRSITEKAVFSSYGPSTQRPLFKTGNQNFISNSGSFPRTSDFITIKGLEIRNHTRDPSDPAFSLATTTQDGIRLTVGADYLLIEDCVVSFYGTGINIDDVDNNGVSNLTLRANLILDQYGHTTFDPRSQGVYIAKTDGNILIEYNIFDHNGWNESIPTAPEHAQNHSMYLQYSNVINNQTVVNNFIARSSDHGLQNRAGGRIANNVFYNNVIGWLIGSNAGFNPTTGNQNPPPFPTGTAENNIILEGRPGELNTNWGTNLDWAINVSFINNIVANARAGGQQIPNNITNDSGGHTYSGEIVHQWGGVGNDTGVPGDYADPERTIITYQQSIGETPTEEAFYAALRAQSQLTFDPRYHIDVIHEYFRSGFDAP
jgi:hypothetical protein